jgi:hypothetical protein
MYFTPFYLKIPNSNIEIFIRKEQGVRGKE